jgi:hypothetical protein
MKTVVRNCIALILGLVVGSAVNMGSIIVGPMLIPPPAGGTSLTGNSGQ